LATAASPHSSITKVCHQAHPCGTSSAEQFPRGSTWGCSNVGCIEAVQHMLGRTETPAVEAGTLPGALRHENAKTQQAQAREMLTQPILPRETWKPEQPEALGKPAS
jgi:hypothetical protein